MRGGVYVAVFDLPGDRSIRVGRLGRFRFRAGVYLYVGSAQRNLEARLARHGRRRKPLRWHVDYLARHARMLGAMVLAGGKEAECRTAAALARRFDRPVRGFGSSDCRCPGHLFCAAPQSPTPLGGESGSAPQKERQHDGIQDGPHRLRGRRQHGSGRPPEKLRRHRRLPGRRPG